jgi:hypothetical protein
VLPQAKNIGGPEGIVDHRVLLHRVPQAVGDLDRLHQGPLTPVDDIGHRPGLRDLRLLTLGGPVPGPALGLTSHHGGDR